MGPEDSGTWLDKLADGGLPQLLAGPAGAAISRLIGASVEIPAAWLEGIAQDVRSKSDARSHVTNAIAKKAAEIAVEDPAVMERGLQNMLGRAYRTQRNKEAVAGLAIEDLAQNPPSADNEGPSDDWMMKFERFAEDASSDDLQIMFGKILAGEIRKPGAVAPATLHFVSMLDRDVASLIERVLPFSTRDGTVFLGAVKPPLTVAEMTFVEHSGFWSTGKWWSPTTDENGFIIFPATNNYGVALHGEAKRQYRVEAALLSRAGRDLMKVVGNDLDFQGIAKALFEVGFDAFYFGKLVERNGRTAIDNPVQIPKTD